MSCQGLLAQFMRPEIRQAFLDDKFMIHTNNQPVLQSMDIFTRRMLLCPGSPGVASAADGDAVKFVTKLLSRDPGEPMDEVGAWLPYRQSFGEWRLYFHSLMSSSYWESPEAGAVVSNMTKLGVMGVEADGTSYPKMRENHNSRFLGVSARDGVHVGVREKTTGDCFVSSVDYDSKPNVSVDCENGKIPSKCVRTHRSHHFYGSDKVAEPNESSNHSGRRHRGRSVKLSTSDSNSSYSGTDAESDRDERRSGGSSRNSPFPIDPSDAISHALKHLRVREVVAPQKFNITSGRSFHKFLSSFERYFSSKYDGTDRDRASQLGLFLQGSALRVYEAMNGSDARYSNLKPKLLDWYHSERSSQKQRGYAELEKAMMGSGESLNIYCMRLEQLAKRAYPDSVKERERHLRRKFRSSVPRQTLDKLENALSSFSLFGEVKLTWPQMRKFAEGENRLMRLRDEDGHSKKEFVDPQTAVWFNCPPSLNPNAPSARRNPDMDRVSDHVKNNYTRPTDDQQRYYSGARPKAGYIRGGMFRGRGALSRNSPPRRQNRQSPPICAWCGRVGHAESGCWRKQGACTSCGSLDHAVRDCFRERSSKSRLTCSLCGEEHLGRDCPQLIVTPPSEILGKRELLNR